MHLYTNRLESAGEFGLAGEFSQNHWSSGADAEDSALAPPTGSKWKCNFKLHNVTALLK